MPLLIIPRASPLCRIARHVRRTTIISRPRHRRWNAKEKKAIRGRLDEFVSTFYCIFCIVAEATVT